MTDGCRTASYAICGATLASNVPLPELLPDGSEDPDIRFRLLPPRCPEGREPAWSRPVLDAGASRRPSLARAGSAYLLRFDDLADFILSEDAREIECRPAPRTAVETIRHLLLDRVLPLALGHRGMLVIQASAVADRDAAIAFVGEAGAGKSTLTACFCRVGWSLMTDDCLSLREQRKGFHAEPSYPGIRLQPDALRALFGAGTVGQPIACDGAKRRVDAGSMVLGMCSRRRPLRVVYVLDPEGPRGPGSAARVGFIPSYEAVPILLEHLLRLDTTDRDRLRGDLERLSRLSEQVPVRKLSFRRDLAALTDVVAAIRRDLASPRNLAPRVHRLAAGF